MKKTRMAFILFLIWGGITIFAGLVGFLEENHKSVGYNTQWRIASKLPVPNGRLISATKYSVYVQGDTNSIYRFDIFRTTDANWEKLSGDETVPSVKFEPCPVFEDAGGKFKEHPFLQPHKQELKTSVCSSGGYSRTDFVLANDDYVWYWTKEIADLEPFFWFAGAVNGGALGFVLGAAAGLISLLILITGQKIRVKMQSR